MTEKVKKYSTIPSEEKAALLAGWLREKQGSRILGLDVRELSAATDIMLLTSAKNTRHAQALADFLLKNCAQERFETLGLEGYKNGQWVLLDCNDVLVHIFLQHNRDFYNLEGLWSQSKRIIDLPDEPPAASDDTGTPTTNAHEAANKDLA